MVVEMVVMMMETVMCWREGDGDGDEEAHLQAHFLFSVVLSLT